MQATSRSSQPTYPTLTQGQGPYQKELKAIETDIKNVQKRVNEKMGVKESDTGLAPPNLWDIPADKQRMGEEHPLQVAWI
jgi:26S proteasome regulatory subunit T1